MGAALGSRIFGTEAAVQTLTIAEVNERIVQFETKNDLLKYRVDGWSIWPLLRFAVGLELMNLAPVAGTKEARLTLGERIIFTIRDIPRLFAVRPSKYVALVHASNRTEQVGTWHKDIFFDDLLHDLGNYYKIEQVDNKTFVAAGRSAFIKTDLTTYGFELLAALLSRFGGPGEISRIATTLCACVWSEFGLASITPRQVSRTLLYFYWSKKLWAWLFGRIAPKYMFIVTAYGNHAMVAAAKERRIEVIEFQHGMLDGDHWGYSWGSGAARYKETMPIPDRIFLYGDFWKDKLSANGFWDKELRSVGSLRMDDYRTVEASGDHPYTILLTTQGLETDRLVAFIADFLAMADTKLKFELYVKLHPIEADKQVYEKVFQHRSNVHILLSRESPSTFNLMTRSDVHISISSTCHYEALGLGVPTIILPFTSHEVIMPLTETGYASLARTPLELLELVLKYQSCRVPAEIGDMFFKSPALENMKKELGYG